MWAANASRVNTMQKQEVFDFLKKSGVCDICCLRFFKARGDEYNDIADSLEKLNISRENHPVEESVKRRRKNPCTACLGFFSDELQEEIVRSIAEHPELEEYDCEKFVIALSIPIILHVRQISFWLALVNKFSDFSKESPPDVAIKEAAKLIINKKLCQLLNKSYDQSGIMINVYLNHPEEISELQKLLKVDEELFEKKSKCAKKQLNHLTRNYLEKNYVPTKISLETFQNHIPVPPAVTAAPLHLENIKLVGPTIFVAGRYQKLSRKLSHTPWVLQGRRVMEDSIQELITRCVAPFYRVMEEDIIFSSSGREDVDVRCLGKGRPFVLEITNSRKTTLSPEEAAKIELEIEKHPKVSVQNLQIVTREEVSFLKAGEEKKRKFYRALCVLKEPVTLEMLQKLDIANGFEIQQLTPIRVLHRRPLHMRPRTVYSIKPFIDKDNPKILILDLVTQAGTYIKELVHGEFGRTHPSISSIVEQWVDIIALDVTGIDLDWPKDIDNRQFVKDFEMNSR